MKHRNALVIGFGIVVLLIVGITRSKHAERDRADTYQKASETMKPPDSSGRTRSTSSEPVSSSSSNAESNSNSTGRISDVEWMKLRKSYLALGFVENGDNIGTLICKSMTWDGATQALGLSPESSEDDEDDTNVSVVKYVWAQHGVFVKITSSYRGTNWMHVGKGIAIPPREEPVTVLIWH